jgi:hypothetical protein
MKNLLTLPISPGDMNFANPNCCRSKWLRPDGPDRTLLRRAHQIKTSVRLSCSRSDLKIENVGSTSGNTAETGINIPTSAIDHFNPRRDEAFRMGQCPRSRGSTANPAAENPAADMIAPPRGPYRTEHGASMPSIHIINPWPFLPCPFEVAAEYPE